MQFMHHKLRDGHPCLERQEAEADVKQERGIRGNSRTHALRK